MELEAFRCVLHEGWMDVEDAWNLGSCSRCFHLLVLEYLHGLRRVHVEVVGSQAARIISVIGNRCMNLNHLTITNASWMREDLILRCAKSKLQSMCVTSSRRLSGETLFRMVSIPERLEVLDVSGCSKVSHFELERCANSHALKYLRALRLMDIPMSLKTFMDLLVSCPKLEELDVGCLKATPFLSGTEWESGGVLFNRDNRRILSNEIDGLSTGPDTPWDATKQRAGWCLRRLSLCHRTMTESEMLQFVPLSSTLRYLDISFNEISSEIIDRIVHHCTGLQVLKLNASQSFRHRMTDGCLLRISHHLTNLVEIHLHQQSKITDSGLMHLACMPYLRTVIISRNNKITTKCIKALIKACGTSLNVKLIRCKRVSTRIRTSTVEIS